MSNKTFKKLSVVKLSTNVREATKVVESPLNAPADDEVLIKNIYAGVVAADVLVISGALFTPEKIPFNFGFESIGVIQSVGQNVKNFKVGQPVATSEIANPQGYAEYQYLKSNSIIAIPELKPEYIGATVGLTSCIGLDKAGAISKGDKVLITAAAGGVGHICVQWAKLKGCHVIGMTSTPEKAKLLTELGCDRVINYRTESLDEVLTKEYPKGIDVIWETIGGQVFQTLLSHLAVKGRLLMVGSISSYKSKSTSTPIDFNLYDMSLKLMMKSQTLVGFSMANYTDMSSEYHQKIVDSIQKKELRTVLDFGQSTKEGQFRGIDSVVRAIDYLQSGRNCGKVMVKLQEP